MQPSLQAKLLQVLQDGEFARLGSRDDVRVDVRVVAATNRDLEQAVADGLFREDLFFRLNVVCITLPPLRQRRDEIPALMQLFLAHYSEHYNKPRSSRRRTRCGCSGSTTGRATSASSRTSSNAWSFSGPTSPCGVTSPMRSPTARRLRVPFRRFRDARPRRPRLRRRRHPRPRRPAPQPPGADRLVEGHRASGGARSGTRADLPDAAAHTMEPPRSRRDARHQLQGAALQDQGSGAR